MITGLHHVCVKTRDWDRTMRFYQDVLGCRTEIAWNFRETGRRAIMLDTGDGNYIEVFEDPDYVGAPNGAVYHFAVRTDKVDELAARVRAFGAKITVEPKDVTIATTNGVGPVPIRIFFCEGPNGEVIEFFQNEIT